MDDVTRSGALGRRSTPQSVKTDRVSRAEAKPKLAFRRLLHQPDRPKHSTGTGCDRRRVNTGTRSTHRTDCARRVEHAFLDRTRRGVAVYYVEESMFNSPRTICAMCAPCSRINSSAVTT